MKKAIVALMLAAACREVMAPVGPTGLTADALAAVVGSWQLASWNGDAVPVHFTTQLKWVPDPCPVPPPPNGCATNPAPGHYEDEYYTEWPSGTIQLSDDGRFTSILDVRRRYPSGVIEPQQPFLNSGNFTGSGSGGPITLRFDGIVSMTGAISGDTMTLRHVVIQNGTPITLGDVWVYTK